MHICLNTLPLPDEIVFCRHGESIGNARGKNDNSIEHTPNHRFNLTSTGKNQALSAGYFLNTYAPHGFDDYYVSTFLRAQETFKLLGLKDNPEPFEDPRLDEYWRDIFHSMSEADVAVFYPIEHAIAEREGWYHYRPPQGEAQKDVELRILSFLSSLSPCKRIFICGHGQWFCFFERILCGKSRNETRRNSPTNCSVVSFKKEGHIFSSKIIFEPEKNAP